MALTDRCRVNTLVDVPGCSPVAGKVVWDPVHSVWNGGMLACALLLAPIFFSWPAVVVCFGLTAATILIGHSVGFHRRMIHRSFACPQWVDYVLVWVGTIVGISGPHWMMRTHDMRDWAQRQDKCHDYLAHRRPLLVDGWWQMHCKIILDQPPAFDLGEAGRDRFYRFLESTWMAQQLPVAALLFACGGWSWVIWGVCVRVTMSVTGHWFVGHIAHRRGPQSWLVDGAGVQAHDVPWAAVPTMGEAWHNNHHAFPGSARIGLYPGQSDWGYAFIVMLERAGLAWDVMLPNDLGRDDKVTAVKAAHTPGATFTDMGKA
jgi:sn-1 stearoyl-lipid 9-desaturase